MTCVRDLRFLPNASVTSVYGEAKNARASRVRGVRADVFGWVDGFVRGTVSIRRRHVAVLSQRSMRQLREAFGLENVLVSTMGQQCATPEMKSRPTLDKEASAEAVSVGAGAGGVRWAAITVSIVAVDIIDRGLKRITGGWDPREHGWKGKPNEPRGQNVIVRTEGGPGSAEVSARLKVKQAPSACSSDRATPSASSRCR